MLEFLTQSAWAERIGWVLVHSLWQFALVAILAVGLQWTLARRSAAIRYWALLAAMFVMVAAPVATWFSSWSSDAPAPAVEHHAVEMPDSILTTQPVSPLELREDATAARVARPERSDGRGESPGDAATPFAEPQGRATQGAAIDLASSLSLVESHIRPWLPQIVLVWFAGVLLAAFRPLFSWYTVRRLKTKGVSPVAGAVRCVLDRTAKTLRVARAVELLQSALVKTPVVIGYFRPAILLPLCVVTGVTGLPEPQLELILAHELAHIRRHDYLINLLQTLVETLFFYHPAVWWLSREIRNERENCCDDVAMATVGNRADYGRALLAIEELRAQSTALSVAASGGSLLARIRRIAGCEPAPRIAEGGGILCVILASMAIFAAVTWGGAAVTERPKKTVAATENPVKNSAAETAAESAAKSGDKKTLAYPGTNEAAKKPDQAAVKKDGGFAVEGTVTSADGKTSAGATVGIYDVTRFPGSVFPRTKTDGNGRYRFNVDEPGEYIVAAVAESSVPAWRRITVDKNRQAVDLKLSKGQPIRVRVVDREGKPMPEVRVGWSIAASDKNAGLIFLDYEREPQKWLKRTDAEGRWNATWIPDDKIRISAQREGYLRADVMLAPNEREKVITLEPGICVSGRVVDKETGAPIKKFRVTDGWQSNPDDGMIWYHTRPVENEKGEYRICFDMLNDGRGICVEADGYFPSPVQRIRNDERQKTCNMELVKGEQITGVIRSPKGTLLADVDVALCTANRGCRLNNGRVVTAPNDYPLTMRTGIDGRFSFPPQNGSCLLVAVHDLGFAEVAKQAGMKDITLRPWAKVEGTVTIDGKPAARQRMSLEYADHYGQSQVFRQRPAARIVCVFDLSTDAKGYFAWDRALPGGAKISRKVPLSKEGWENAGWTDANSRSIELFSGRTLAVTFKDSDVPIIQEREDNSRQSQPANPAAKTIPRKVEPAELPRTGLVLLEGKPAPELRDIVAWKNGGPVKLSDLKGKVVVLVISARWVADRPHEWMPNLFTICDKYRAQGLSIIEVRLNPNSGIDSQVKLDQRIAELKSPFWEDRDLPIPIALALWNRPPSFTGYFSNEKEKKVNGNSLCAILQDYGFGSHWPISLPLGVLIDRQGRIVGEFDLRSGRDNAVLEKLLQSGKDSVTPSVPQAAPPKPENKTSQAGVALPGQAKVRGGGGFHLVRGNTTWIGSLGAPLAYDDYNKHFYMNRGAHVVVLPMDGEGFGDFYGQRILSPGVGREDISRVRWESGQPANIVMPGAVDLPAYQLLLQPAVQRALRLSDQQRNKLRDIAAKYWPERRRIAGKELDDMEANAQRELAEENARAGREGWFRSSPGPLGANSSPFSKETVEKLERQWTSARKQIEDALTPEQLRTLKDLTFRTFAFGSGLMFEPEVLGRLGVDKAQQDRLRVLELELQNEKDRRLRSVTREKIKKVFAVLTPQQVSQLREKLSPDKNPETDCSTYPYPGLPSHLPDTGLAEELAFSAEQRERVRKIVAAHWTKLKALQQEDEKPAIEDDKARKAIGEKRRQEMADLRKQLETALTPEQWASCKEMAFQNQAILWLRMAAQKMQAPSGMALGERLRMGAGMALAFGWMGLTGEQVTALRKIEAEYFDKPEQIYRELTDKALAAFTPPQQEGLRAEVDRRGW